MNFPGKNHHHGLTFGQINAFLSVWDRINQGTRESLIFHLRRLARYAGDMPMRYRELRLIECILCDWHDCIEHVVAVQTFMDEMRGLPLRCFSMMCDSAKGQPLPPNEQQVEGQQQELHADEHAIRVSESDESNDQSSESSGEDV